MQKEKKKTKINKNGNRELFYTRVEARGYVPGFPLLYPTLLRF